MTRRQVMLAAGAMMLWMGSGGYTQVVFPILPDPGYPRLEVNPMQPEEGDTVSLWLVKGLHPNGCVPTYTASYTIETLPQEIYPPNRIVHLTYTEQWPPKGYICTMVQTEYGPRFTLPDIEIGNYTVMDGDKNVGTFGVIEQGAAKTMCTIDGVVTDDPFPTKRATRPIKGAKVYLYEEIYYILDAQKQLLPPAGAVIIDSTVTGEDGSYKIADIAAGWYRISFVAAGYVTRTMGLSLTGDTTINVALLTEGASASVSGIVTAINPDCPENADCVVQPVEGCSITVILGECEDVVHPLRSSTPVTNALIAPICPVYTAVTDAEGRYTISDVPLIYNGQTATAAARKTDFSTVVKTVLLYNGTTAEVNFQLQPAWSHRGSVTVDGVVYSVVTEKAVYNKWEYLKARYIVDNQSQKTVTFGGHGPGQDLCTYGMTLADQDGNTVYSTSDHQVCTMIYLQWDLAPGEKDSIEFPPYYLDGDYTALTVSAQMLGNDETKASVDIAVQALMSTDARKAAAVHASTAGTSMSVSRPGVLTLNLARGQKVTIGLYRLNGSRIALLADNTRLAAGRHEIKMNTSAWGKGVAVVLVSGEDFSMTERIRLR